MSQKKSTKSYVRDLNEKTKKNAYNLGKPWSDDDVSDLVNMIERDEKTFDMAMSLGRTFYGTQYARSHVRFAMDHAAVIIPALRSARRREPK